MSRVDIMNAIAVTVSNRTGLCRNNGPVLFAALDLQMNVFAKMFLASMALTSALICIASLIVGAFIGTRPLRVWFSCGMVASSGLLFYSWFVSSSTISALSNQFTALELGFLPATLFPADIQSLIITIAGMMVYCASVDLFVIELYSVVMASFALSTKVNRGYLPFFNLGTTISIGAFAFTQIYLISVPQAFFVANIMEVVSGIFSTCLLCYLLYRGIQAPTIKALICALLASRCLDIIGSVFNLLVSAFEIMTCNRDGVAVVVAYPSFLWICFTIVAKITAGFSILMTSITILVLNLPGESPRHKETALHQFGPAAGWS